MGTYNILVQKPKSNLDIKLGGKFVKEDVDNFMLEFNDTLKTINPKEYDISFDVNELQVSPQEMVPLLEDCFKYYKALGFKKIVINVGDNAILKMQVNRVARSAGIDYEII